MVLKRPHDNIEVVPGIGYRRHASVEFGIAKLHCTHGFEKAKVIVMQQFPNL
jgi:hypothetical protein